jgi:hypothetical protein
MRAWWRRTCIEQALDQNQQGIKGHEWQERYQGGLALMIAIENEVNNAGEMIDGRATRWANQKAAAARSGAGTGNGKAAR